MEEMVAAIVQILVILSVSAAILGGYVLHIWLKRRGRANVMPYVALVLVSFLLFFGCAFFYAVTGATGLHYHYAFWHSDSFLSNNFVLIIGLSGVVFGLSLIFLTRIVSWRIMLPIVGVILFIVSLLLVAAEMIVADFDLGGPFAEFYTYLGVVVGFILLAGSAGFYVLKRLT